MAFCEPIISQSRDVESGHDRIFGTTCDQVQELGRSPAIPDGGEVEDHGHVRIAAAGVTSRVFVDPDHPHHDERRRVTARHIRGLFEHCGIRAARRRVKFVRKQGRSQALESGTDLRPAKPVSRVSRSGADQPCSK